MIVLDQMIKILLDWGGFNFIGVDLSRLTVGCTQGHGWPLDICGRVGRGLPSKVWQFVPRTCGIGHAAAVPHALSIWR